MNQKPASHVFTLGKRYNRREEIHAEFGGNHQAGISPSKSHPFIFIFTGSSGEKFGYSDEWLDKDVFHYTGEGRRGDMTFVNKANRAVRDHVQDGKDILLFKHLHKNKLYEFLGQFVCTGYEFKQISDADDKLRRGIIFHLKNVDTETELADDDKEFDTGEYDNFNDLRSKAYSAVSDVKESKISEGRKAYYRRNMHIKAYVLRRSKGFCECCGKPAPFFKKDNSPYLEPHHIYKLSDKGLDHPVRMAAVTPNCHREIHHGINGDEIDRRLAKLIEDKEKSYDSS